MSANDFKAQATIQSIGATSIPSEEIFGIASLALNTKVTVSSGIISQTSFPSNSTLNTVNNVLVSSGVASSEAFLNNNTFGQNTYFTIPSISLLLRDAALTSPTITSSIGITLNPIDSTENFLTANISNVSYISFTGNGISSQERLGIHSFGNISYLIVSPVSSQETLNTNSYFASSNNIYPASISSLESLNIDNYFGALNGIVLTQGIRSTFSSPSNSYLSLLGSRQHITQNSGIVSALSFGRRTTFYPPPPSYLRKGFIYGYTVIVNNILVTLERENLLDTVTKIPRKINSFQTRSESLNGYVEIAHLLSSSIDVVYSIEAEIIQEQSLIARQSKHYLESYIKPKYKISSTIYVEQNNNFYNKRNGTIN